MAIIKRKIACTDEVKTVKTVKQLKLVEHENGHTFFIHKDKDYKSFFVVTHLETGFSVTTKRSVEECEIRLNELMAKNDFNKRLKKAKKELKKRKYKYPLNEL